LTDLHSPGSKSTLAFSVRLLIVALVPSRLLSVRSTGPAHEAHVDARDRKVDVRQSRGHAAAAS
jgi:hypothetical protein